MKKLTTKEKIKIGLDFHVFCLATKSPLARMAYQEDTYPEIPMSVLYTWSQVAKVTISEQEFNKKLFGATKLNFMGNKRGLLRRTIAYLYALSFNSVESADE